MTLTFQDILTRFASQAQVALDADTGLPTLSRQEEHRFTQYLNEAAAWVWRGKFDRWTFPELITGKTVTLGANGLITAATLDNATFWSVWDTDPRNAMPTERQRLQLRATAKGNGDLLVDEGEAGTTVFVIYRTRVPKWSAVLASGYASTVSAETRLWNKLCGTDGDGEVYRALIANANLDDFTDTTEWEPVNLEETLLETLVAKAMALRQMAAGLPASASQYEARAIDWLENRVREADINPSDKPWLYNANA
jgi:hypothetical protein